MTTELKAKSVDVLGVMDAAAKTCKLYGHDKSANELPKARAAVAELIDASHEYIKAEEALANREYMGIYAEPYEKLQPRLHTARESMVAALKRIGGEG